jgi:hypothetical protein
MIGKFIQVIAALFAVFIFLIAILQFQDGYVGYGLTSLALGSASLFLVRFLRNRKRNF